MTIFVIESFGLFSNHAIYLVTNQYLLSTCAGDEQSCQTLLSLMVVKHYWVHKRWQDQIHNSRAAFSKVFSMGPTLACWEQWENTTVMDCRVCSRLLKINCRFAGLLLLLSMKLGPNDVVTLHPRLVLKDPKLFIVTCVLLRGVFGWINSKDKAIHLSHLIVNKDIFKWCAGLSEWAGTYLHIHILFSVPVRPPGQLWPHSGYFPAFSPKWKHTQWEYSKSNKMLPSTQNKPFCFFEWFLYFIRNY